MIVCGWCGHPTEPPRCSACGHEDPAKPWVQRDQEPPVVRTDATGRPGLDPKVIRRRLHDATRVLGEGATVERTAEHLGVSPKTVRRWREMTR